MRQSIKHFAKDKLLIIVDSITFCNKFDINKAVHFFFQFVFNNYLPDKPNPIKQWDSSYNSGINTLQYPENKSR